MKSLKLKIFWKSHVISQPLITNHAQEVPMIPYLSRSTAGIWPREAFGLCSRFEIVMLGKKRANFLMPYFKFENKFFFRFLCDEYVHMIFCVCLPDITENSVNCHGKVMEFYYQIEP